MTMILASGWGWWCWPCLNTLVCGQSRERTRCNSWENPWKPAGTKKARPSAFFQKRSQTACPLSIVQFCAAKLVKPRVGADVLIADISQHRQYPFQAHVLFSLENAKYWPILAILSRIYALFGVLFTGLLKLGGVPEMTNIRSGMHVLLWVHIWCFELQKY